jgi:hypothetical protein
MMKSTFWTQRRFTGITLIVGCLLFLAGASMPLTDTKGNFIWGLPPREWLRVLKVNSFCRLRQLFFPIP